MYVCVWWIRIYISFISAMVVAVVLTLSAQVQGAGQAAAVRGHVEEAAARPDGGDITRRRLLTAASRLRGVHPRRPGDDCLASFAPLWAPRTCRHREAPSPSRLWLLIMARVVCQCHLWRLAHVRGCYIT